MVGNGKEVGTATSGWKLLGVKIVGLPAEAPILRHPSFSFFISFKSTLTSFSSAFTALTLFLSLAFGMVYFLQDMGHLVFGMVYLVFSSYKYIPWINFVELSPCPLWRRKNSSSSQIWAVDNLDLVICLKKGSSQNSKVLNSTLSYAMKYKGPYTCV